MHTHTNKIHATKCWCLTHTIKNAFSFIPRLSGQSASNHTFKVCRKDSNLSQSGSSWVGGGDTAALNGPFDTAKHLPSSGGLYSLALAPWGSPRPKGKQTGVHPPGHCPITRGLSWLALSQAVHSMACFPFSQVASSFPCCWPEGTPANGSFEGTVVQAFKVPNSWPYSIVNHR